MLPSWSKCKHQAEIVMELADVIVFVVCLGKNYGCDEYVARKLCKTYKPVILAVNKVDKPQKCEMIFFVPMPGLENHLLLSTVSGQEMCWMLL